jgi:hypothetical protein
MSDNLEVESLLLAISYGGLLAMAFVRSHPLVGRCLWWARGWLANAWTYRLLSLNVWALYSLTFLVLLLLPATPSAQAYAAVLIIQAEAATGSFGFYGLTALVILWLGRCCLRKP